MRIPVSAFMFILLFLAGCGSQESSTDRAEPESGEDVVRAMHTAYAGDWYETLTFVQTTINHGPTGADTSLWYEALKLPGLLRIDIGRPSSGDTWIFRNDSIYVWSGGQLVNAIPTLHPLLLLGFDIYHEPVDRVLSKLDTLGYDLSRMYDTEWNGRGVYAVGADSAGTDAPEFWIDRERLVFVRLLQNVGPGGSIRQDIRFDAYERLGDGWIAPEVRFFADSTMMLEELYGDVQIGMELDDALFEPGAWQSAGHWVPDEDEDSPTP